MSGWQLALATHEPRSPREERSLRQIQGLVAWLREPLSETADPTHVTGSALIHDGAGRIVLHRHKRLGLWLQPGGHVDPGETPDQGAVRESREETGLPVEHPPSGPTLVHVDVHEAGRGHLHLDLRYELLAPPGAPLRPAPGESPDVGWLSFDEAAARGDTSVADAVHALSAHLGA